MKKTVIIPALVLVLCCIGAFVLVATAPSIESKVPDRAVTAVRVRDPQPQSVPMWVRSQGTVEPRTESALVPEVSGRVVWVSPALVSGGFFDEGEPLLRVETRSYEMAVSRARAAVARARGEVDFAADELARQKGMSARNVASPAQLSAARRNDEVAKADLTDAAIGLEQASWDLERTTVVAPYRGRVRVESVDVGQVILRAQFAGKENTWRGLVVRTEGEIDPKSRMVHVVARVEDPYAIADQSQDRAPLAVGLFVHAEIRGPAAEDVIVVPRYAMRDANHILVIDRDDLLRIRKVEILRIDGEEVLIRGSLEPGERLCVSPVQVVVDGMKVTTIQDDEETPKARS
jgi:multidrug efflux pump subunit AcrA (membrane-fusion protein)